MGNKIKKFDVQSNVKIKILEKKPQKGGTPAIENKAIIRTFVQKLFIPNEENECKVLTSVLKN